LGIRENIAAGMTAGKSSLKAKTEWVVLDLAVLGTMQGNVPESMVGSFEYSCEIDGDQILIEAQNPTTLESLWRNPWDRERQLEPMYSYFSTGSDLTGMCAPVCQTFSWTAPLDGERSPF
jgi:hypothetical protein